MSSVCGGSEIFELQSPTLSVMSSDRQRGGKQEEGAGGEGEEEDSRDNEQKLLNKLSMGRRNAYNNASSARPLQRRKCGCGGGD